MLTIKRIQGPIDAIAFDLRRSYLNDDESRTVRKHGYGGSQTSDLKDDMRNQLPVGQLANFRVKSLIMWRLPETYHILHFFFADIRLGLKLGWIIAYDSLRDDLGFSIIRGSEALKGDGIIGGFRKERKENESC